MSENHPSLDESKPSIGKVLDDEDNKVAEFIQFLRRKVSSGLCTDDQIKVLEDVRESLSTLFSVSGPSYEVRKSKPLSDICVGAEGPTQPNPQSMQRSGPELMDLLQQWDSEMNDHERVRVLSAFKQSDGLADFEKLKRLTESIKKLVYVLYPDGKFQPEPIPQLIQLLDDFVSAGLVSAVSSTNSVEESIEDILLLAKQLIQTLQQTEEYVQACEAESSTAENNETLTGGVKADGELGINKDGGDQKPQSMQQLMDQLLQQLDIGKEEFKKDGLADFEKVIRLTELMKELLFVFYTDGKLPADAEPVLAKIEYFARVIEILFEEQNKPTYSGRDDKKIENVLIVGKLLIETLQQTKEYKQACGAESSTAENNESLTGGVKADGELGINKDGGDQNRIAPEGN